MKKNITSKILFFLATVFVMGFSLNANALTITPARLELSGDPGTTISGEFTITNEQDQDKTFYSSSENFESSGETGAPSFVISKEGLASWIQSNPTITLKKGEERKVSFTITIPKDADAGGHFAAIFLSTVPSALNTGQVSVGAKIGVLIFLRVSGEVKEGGGITDFDTKDKKTFFSSLPIGFVYRFNNSGNDRVNPMGDMVINNILGMQKASISANPNQGNILPGSTRRFDVLWGEVSTDKMGFFSMAGYEWRHFAFGFYTAHLALAYGHDSKSEISKTVFVFPWQLLILFFIILAVAIFIFGQILKRYNRFIINKAQNMQ